ncbi:MAG: nucleotidyltransferase, partial [bacterium]
EIINYPKLHRDNCTAKHQSTGNWFKPTVRMFKNMRSRLVKSAALSRDTAPSYFVEGLLYNVPDGEFGASFQDTFCNCVNWLREANQSEFACANGKLWLFGTRSTQWSQDDCDHFLSALVDMWNKW